MAENDIVVPELDEDGRFTAGSVIDQIGEIAAEAAPALDLTGGFDGSVALGSASVATPGPEVAPGARVHGGLAIAIGAAAEAHGSSVAIGGKALDSASIAVGSLTEAGGLSTAVGYTAKAPGFGATALGLDAEARGASSVALGSDAIAENDNDFVLGASSHNVKVPGTLSTQEPTEPQQAATKGYVDNAVASAGGGDWVAVHSLTPSAGLEYATATFWVANPGCISLIEANAVIPAGPGGEEHEFTLDLDALPPRAQALVANMGGHGAAVLTGIDEDTWEAAPVLLSLSANLILTPLADHGRLSVYGTLLLPTRRGELD